jgi:hypothetical protein
LGDLSEYTPWKQVDCDDDSEDPLCNGLSGQDGFLFCDLKDRFPDVIYMYRVQRNDYAGISNLSQYSNNKQVDCDDSPNHPFCNGKRGQDGYMFCELRDELPDDMDLTCWDNDEFSNDDPLVYCATDPETKQDCKIEGEEEVNPTFEK